jgi:L-ribulose-5-phosphate 4-epimerase
MSFERLKERAWQANLDLVNAGLVTLTFGNASEADPQAGAVAIKPSGVSYNRLTPDDMVVLSIETGERLEGALNPSSDAPTHLAIYRAFPSIHGITHTHSNYATAWAQSCREIPCLGTTHADHFDGPVPLTRELSDQEIESAYEENTGKIIVESLSMSGNEVFQVPAILVPHHGPFTWGRDSAEAVANSIALEAVAKMALHTLALNAKAEIPQALLEKHFTRKHGPSAYYGQKE